MPLTSFGEVLGALEREAKRTRELYEAAVELSKLDGAAADKRRELQQLQTKINAAVANEAAALERSRTAQAQASDDVRQAHQRVDVAKAEVAQQLAALRADMQSVAKTEQAVLTTALDRARATVAQAQKDAEAARVQAASVKADVERDLEVLTAQRDRIKDDVAALRQRILNT